MIALKDILKQIPKLELDESKKKILLLYGLAFLITLALYLYIFLLPSVNKLFVLIPKVRTSQENIKTVTLDLEHKDALMSKAKDLDQKMSKYAVKLTREKELPKLLESLSRIAKSSRVRILGITPLPPRNLMVDDLGRSDAVYQEVPIAISAISGYHDLGVFINKLENDERYMEISDIKIRSKSGSPRRHDIQFVVYAYTVR